MGLGDSFAGAIHDGPLLLALPVAAAAGLSRPVIKATRPSAFGGSLYVAVAERLDPQKQS